MRKTHRCVVDIGASEHLPNILGQPRDMAVAVPVLTSCHSLRGVVYSARIETRDNKGRGDPVVVQRRSWPWLEVKFCHPGKDLQESSKITLPSPRSSPSLTIVCS